jgi:hypothetical protein
MNYKIIPVVVLVAGIVAILLHYLGTGSKFDIDEAKFEELFKQSGATVVDVRTEREFKEGKIAFVVCSLPYKCPGAPHEGAMLIADYFQRRGIRDK